MGAFKQGPNNIDGQRCLSCPVCPEGIDALSAHVISSPGQFIEQVGDDVNLGGTWAEDLRCDRCSLPTLDAAERLAAALQSLSHNESYAEIFSSSTSNGKHGLSRLAKCKDALTLELRMIALERDHPEELERFVRQYLMEDEIRDDISKWRRKDVFHWFKWSMRIVWKEQRQEMPSWLLGRETE